VKGMSPVVSSCRPRTSRLGKVQEQIHLHVIHFGEVTGVPTPCAVEDVQIHPPNWRRD